VEELVVMLLFAVEEKVVEEQVVIELLFQVEQN
jgi:hypothetical protein